MSLWHLKKIPTLFPIGAEVALFGGGQLGISLPKKKHWPQLDVDFELLRLPNLKFKDW